MLRMGMVVGMLMAGASVAAAQQADDDSVRLPDVEPALVNAPRGMAAGRVEAVNRDAIFARHLEASDSALTAAMLAQDRPDERHDQLAQARAHARAALTLKPQDPEALFNLGAAIGLGVDRLSGRARMQAAGEVRRLTDSILADQPNHPGGLHLDGQLHAAAMRLGGIERFLARTIFGGDVLDGASWEAAERSFRAAMKVDPDNPAHRYELARVLRDTGREAEARQLLQQIVRSPTRHAVAELYRKRAIAQLDQQ